MNKTELFKITSFGFAIAQTTRGFQGFRPRPPMNLPGAIDFRLGGSGVAGTAVDGVINFHYSASNIERAYHAVSTYRNIINLRTGNPSQTGNFLQQNNHFMVPDNTRVYVPIMHR